MSNKLKLTKLTLETKDGKPVELSIEEARELYSQLDELFGTKTIYAPSLPVYIERHTWPQYQPFWHSTSGAINCSVEGSSGLKVSYSGDMVE